MKLATGLYEKLLTHGDEAHLAANDAIRADREPLNEESAPHVLARYLHDALVRAYSGQKMGPSLAESWEESEDGKTYEFRLRPGLRFHNGDPLTAEDVKFSFERYQGAGADTLKDHVQEVEIVDPRTVRFHLKEPWPDFMAFYGTTATAAGIVVPKNYLTQVGEDGFKKQPIGAGPYKFVSSKPGVEVVLEANSDYWRRVPNVKTLVMRSVPEATTRALMVKTGEADMAYALDGVDVRVDDDWRSVYRDTQGESLR